MKNVIIYIALALSAVLAVAAYRQSELNGNAEFHAHNSELDQIRYLNTAIDREVLLLESGRKLDFDRLTDETRDLGTLMERADVLTAFSRAGLRDALKRKIDGVEDFKSRLAVYRNSARSGTQLVSELAGNHSRLADADRITIIPAERAFLTHLAFGDRSHLEHLKAILRASADANVSPQVDGAWTAFRTHASVVASVGQEVEDLMRSITDPSMSEAVVALASNVREYYAAREQSAAVWRAVLLGSALSFAALLMWAVRLNIRKTRDLQHLNAELEDRVEERTRELTSAGEELRGALEENKQQQVSLLRLSSAIQRAAEGVAVLSADLSVQFANPAYADIVGYAVDELVGRPHPDIDRLSEDPRFAGHTHQDGAARDADSVEMVMRRKSGEEITVEQSVVWVEDNDTLVSSYVVICRDVTERNRLKVNLLQSQKLESIGQLAAGIAHEINNPVQYVNDNVHFFEDVWKDIVPLLTRCRDGTEAEPESKQLWEQVDGNYLLEEVPTALSQASQGLQQISKIVQAMKNFAHPGVDEKEETDINSIIQDTITIAKSEWKYVADVQTDLDETLPYVPAVRSALNQVWLNMIVNAAHAIEDVVGNSGQMGVIRVSTRSVEQGVEVRISDTGTGMPEAIRTRVFDPFFTTKEVGKGSGQGLAIAHGIIAEQHGGSIDVESEEGKGTTFIVTLPGGPWCSEVPLEESAA